MPLALVSVSLAFLSACKSTNANQGDGSNVLATDPDRRAAFDGVKDLLVQEAQALRPIKTTLVMVDANTQPSVITAMIPAKNPDPDCEAAKAQGLPCIPRGPTPEILEGVYWMRGNPLPDYLLSFANNHWTEANGSPFSYIPTYAPGSFIWKEKRPAQGSAPNDFETLPQICNVPNDDTLNAIAHMKSTHDPELFRRSIAVDFATKDEAPAPANDAAAAEEARKLDENARDFIERVLHTDQFALDGGRVALLLAGANVFYEAKYGPDFKTAEVVVFGLAGGTPAQTPVQIGIPEEIASFSFAPHLTDKDVFVRKTFIENVSKTPNYYYLTRIIDGNGAALPHYKEFLECVRQRSDGRVLKTELAFPKQ
jgi:hypothetical protein